MVQSAIIYDKARNRSIVPSGGDREPNWRTYEEGEGPTREQSQFIDESQKEALKDAIKEQAKHEDKFNKLIARASKVLYKINTVFPFDFFPTIITIDPEKVTLKIKNFFNSSEIRSIHIKNISHIFVDTGPFFATLNIIDQSVLEDNVGKVQIPYIKKEEALRARRIIQGLIVANKEGVDLFKLTDNDLDKKLEEIGRMQ